MPETPITISQLTERIKSTLETNFISVYVSGEISNYKHHSSGHHYFSLKDDGATISCTIWRNTPVRFRLENGMKVIIRGSVTVYAPQGKYQIECSQIVPEGIGDLYLAYEQLKRDLEQKGYFSQERKREIPLLPMKVGISTSPTGAAVQDMISTIQRRFRHVQIYFQPTLVQGEGSAEDIARAVRKLNEYDPDVIIIGRGGGSLEDLWSYNTEIVADAIFTSKAPIISAVGHETDFTIADFVADLRAATPTAAAEICTPITTAEFETRLISLRENIFNKIQGNLNNLSRYLEVTFSNNYFRRLLDRVHFLEQKTDDYQNQSERAMKNKLELFDQKINSLQFTLANLHPLHPLEKGFALLKQKKKYLKSDEVPKINTELEIIRKENIIKTKVISTSNNMFDII
jgi:exodeoxyribonuclease VII large subunit